MGTKQGFLAPQAYNEQYGQIIGLFGDPANQEGTHGTSAALAYNYIDWSNKSEPLRGVLVWSRLLLVEILTPYDTNFVNSKLALVLRPRSLWLYRYSATECADFVGNTSLYSEVGRAGHLDEIVEVNPPYRYGDVIRIGTLAAPVHLEHFTDNYSRSVATEYYDEATERTPTIAEAVQNVYIKGATWNANKYTNFQIEDVLYYDKNVDGRTRIVGGAGPAGEQITVSLCVGGQMKIYRITGEEI